MAKLSLHLAGAQGPLTCLPLIERILFFLILSPLPLLATNGHLILLILQTSLTSSFAFKSTCDYMGPFASFRISPYVMVS